MSAMMAFLLPHHHRGVEVPSVPRSRVSVCCNYRARQCPPGLQGALALACASVISNGAANGASDTIPVLRQLNTCQSITSNTKAAPKRLQLKTRTLHRDNRRPPDNDTAECSYTFDKLQSPGASQVPLSATTATPTTDTLAVQPITICPRAFAPTYKHRSVACLRRIAPRVRHVARSHKLVWLPADL